MPNPRWKIKPAGSTWGDFGPDDQLGRLNLVTPEKVKQGIAEVREGLSFCLSMPLDYPGGNVLNPRRNPPVLSPTQRSGKPNMAYPLSRDDPKLIDVVCDDVVLLTLQYSTQWDCSRMSARSSTSTATASPRWCSTTASAPASTSSGRSIIAAARRRRPRVTGVRRGSAWKTWPATCVQGRAVMIDLLAHFGRARRMIGYEDLMMVLDKDKVTVEQGDFVCLRTGFDQVLLEFGRKPDESVHDICAVLDGRDARLQQWVTDAGVVALISDNYAVEGVPSRPCDEHADHCASLPLHAHCLFRLGVYLGEIWYLSELADWLRARKRTRFLLTAPPLRLPGAVGSPATPVATV